MTSLFPGFPRPRHQGGARALRIEVPVTVRTAGGLLLVLALGACQEPAAPPQPESHADTGAAPDLSVRGPDLTFDWRAPDRFGTDQNGDGLIDYHRSVADIRPARWPIVLDACRFGTHARFEWVVAGRHIGPMTSCSFTHEFPAEGVYEVMLQVRREGRVHVRRRNVVVQDWLIVSLGDSYGSGEGVPDVPLPTGVQDQIRQARQDLGAAAQAVSVAGYTLGQAQAQLAAAGSSLAAAAAALGSALSSLGAAQAHWNNTAAAADRIERDCEPTVAEPLKFFSSECRDALGGLVLGSWNDAKAHADRLLNDAGNALNAARAAAGHAQAAKDQAAAAFSHAQAAVASAQTALGNTQSGYNAAYGALQGLLSRERPAWQDAACHRSANAGAAQAALQLERADPRTSVTFVHLACSGAVIRDLLIASPTGQVRALRELAGPREIDALVISIGGNDAQFSAIVKACMVQEPCYSSSFATTSPAALCPGLLAYSGGDVACLEYLATGVPPSSAADILAAGLAGMPDQYARLDADLRRLIGLRPPGTAPGQSGERPGYRTSRVYITEYSDATRADDGSYCQLGADPLAVLPGWSREEAAWADSDVGPGINAQVSAAAVRHGWRYVTGIYGGFGSHGYCAGDHWVVRLDESQLAQSDNNGTMHPNLAGHRWYAGRIVDALIADLYPGGLVGAPRLPDPPRPGRGGPAGG